MVIVLQCDDECLRLPSQWRGLAQRVSRFVFSRLSLLGIAWHQLLVTQIQRLCFSVRWASQHAGMDVSQSNCACEMREDENLGGSITPLQQD